MEFTFLEKPFHHKYALSLNEISFSYTEEKPLIQDFSIHVGARDRVMVVGPNGKGKTTLLKIIAGVLKPQTGTISSPKSVSVGYYEQSYAENLSPENTVLEEIASANHQLEPGRVRTIAGTLMFEGDDALKPLKVLSGGEKSRVLLGKILATPVNVLLLDEPTNHLDLESCDALLAALDNFDGAVVMVTHNEMFLQALSERLIVFQDDKITVFEGDYETFLRKVGWSEEKGEKASETIKTVGESFKFKLTPREIRQLRSEVIIEKSRILKPLEDRVIDLENQIEETEKQVNNMTQQIIEASVEGNGQEVVRLSRQLDSLRKNLDSLYEEYTQTYQDYEEKREIFERRLQEIEKYSS